MKSFRTVLSLLMVAVLLVGFLVVPGSATDTPPMGDVSGDGKLNLGDVTRIYSHIRNVRLITDEQALGRADLTGDGKLNIGDVARLYSQIRNGVGIKTNVTLKVWAPYEDQQEDNSWLLAMEESFQKKHPEYNITWVNAECSVGDVNWQMEDDPESAADVYLFANDQMGFLKDINALSPLRGKYLEQVMADNSQTLVNTVTGTDDQVYGFPIANNTWFMYYNKNVFSEEDVKSLDTMLTKGRVAFPWDTPWYSGTFFLANGGQIFGEKGNDAAAGIQFGVNNGGYEAALKMVQLANHPNLVNDSNGLGNSGLRDGSVGAYFSGSWDYAGLKESLGDQLGAVQLPTVEIDGEQKQMKAFGASVAVGVNSYSDYQAVALEFAAHLASVEGQKLRYQVRGVIPAAKALINDPEVAANPVAMAEINTMSNASVGHPSIPEMGNYWTPMWCFGDLLSMGRITEDNYKEQVDHLMETLNNFDIYEPEDPELPGSQDSPWVLDAVNYEKDVVADPEVADFWEPNGIKHHIRIPELAHDTAAALALNQKIYNNHSYGYQRLLANQEANQIYECNYEYKVYNGIVALAVFDETWVQAGGGSIYYEVYYFDLNRDRELSFDEYLSAVGIEYDTVVSRIMQTPEYLEEVQFAGEPIVDMTDCLIDEDSTTAFFVNMETMDGWCAFWVASVLNGN